MAICSYCDDEVGMPYTCKMCGIKLCSKHRLPEKHECANIERFKSPEYKRAKIYKDQEYRNIKSYNTDSAVSAGESIFSRTWTSGKKFYDMMIIAAIASFFTLFSFNIVTILAGFIYALFSVYLIFGLRDYMALKGGGVSNPEIYPIGVAFTFILGILSWPLLLVVKFNDHMDEKTRSNAGLVTIFSLLFLGILPAFIPFYEISPILAEQILRGLFSVALKMRWTSLILFLPYRGFEGQYIFQYNMRTYFIALIVTIFIFVLV